MKKFVFSLIVLNASDFELEIKEIETELKSLMKKEESKLSQALIQRVPIDRFFQKLLASHPDLSEEERVLAIKPDVSADDVIKLAYSINQSVSASENNASFENALFFIKNSLKEIQGNHKTYEQSHFVFVSHEPVQIIGFSLASLTERREETKLDISDSTNSENFTSMFS